ncbi:MAG: hypothetical protein ACD_43C00286G0001 [uncultured bacterium]|nr:MAG: hypothetical protein ACD_43C00286G0001 [uncultured bacterium]HBY73075.1 hypothetical protein [Candidatus Kerfeldbacteria bacterium]
MKRAKKTSLKFKPRQTLFWDVNPKTVHPKKHSTYVIERIMDFGKDDEVRWMVHYYPKQKLKRVAFTSRVLQPRSRVFWQLVLK